MKLATMILIVLAIGLVVTGCSKNTVKETATTNTASNTANVVSDIALDDTVPDSDIGALDNTSVSDSIPQ